MRTESVGRASQRRFGKSEFTLRMEADRDEAPCLTRCLFCREVYTGTAAEGRAWALEHRRKEHPQAPVKLRRRGKQFVRVRA